MVKVLAWVTLGVSLLFVALALTAVFGWDSLGEDTARMVGQWAAVPLAIVAILLAVAILVTSWITSEPSES
jgi:ABC-type transport system involved in multi-copper enzyme maturation permease subunit